MLRSARALCRRRIPLRGRGEYKDRLELPFEPGMPANADAIAERARVLAASL